MTDGAKLTCVTFWLLITMLLVSAIFGTTISNQPPDHCRYMVPVKNVPGSYGCSEYPQPIYATKHDLKRK